MIQYSFERFEKKYFITKLQKEKLLKKIGNMILADEYGVTPILNIYYDTENWDLIRASIEKPGYKEKLRVRSYGVPKGSVFAEIKKKCGGVVYKRRISGSNSDITKMLAGKMEFRGQIGDEIGWFQNRYNTFPRVFIGYDRIAYFGKEDKNVRITFDENLRWRDYDLDLSLGDYGEPVLSENKILMEIKIPGACPLWLARALSELEIYPTSFSKYGECFVNNILTKKEAHLCA